MVFSSVRSGDQDHIGFFDLGDGIGHCATSESCGQTGHCGGMSEPGTMIDVVGFQNSPCKLVGQIIFFVGNTGGCQDADAVRSGLVFDLTESLGNQIEGLIPGGFPEVPVLLNQGSGQVGRDR